MTNAMSLRERDHSRQTHGVSGKTISTYDAVLVGWIALDLALLKIEASGLRHWRLAMRARSAGRTGDGIRQSLGMDNSVSMGIVSAAARQLSDDDRDLYTDRCSHQPGNSGGVVNTEGHLIGINTFIFQNPAAAKE